MLIILRPPFAIAIFAIITLFRLPFILSLLIMGLFSIYAFWDRYWIIYAIILRPMPLFFVIFAIDAIIIRLMSAILFSPLF